jgi:hypothetical protein
MRLLSGEPPHSLATEEHHVRRGKRVLLGLRGRRDTIPMICGKSRVIHGWRLESRSRLWSAVVNHYSRGRQSFVYSREQNAYRVSCPPKGGSTSEGV